MDRSENISRSLMAFVAGVFLAGIVGLFAVGWLSLANARLWRENQELRAAGPRIEYQQAPPAPIAYAPLIRVNISGCSSQIRFAPTEIGGATGDVNVSGVSGTTMIYLNAGQTAQVTMTGVSNNVYIDAALTGRVSCTDTGTSNSVSSAP